MTRAPRFSETVKLVCNRQLAEFVSATSGVVMAQLTTSDGFELGCQPVGGGSRAKIAAMGSSLQALSEALVVECGQRHSRNVIIESEEGHLAVMAVPGIAPGMTLLVVANKSAVLGQLLWAARNCCGSLGSVLASVKT
jgi:predicted regulator of Ras-like GTPase activity (Roadblock/LC7/MglB family)